MKSKLQRVARYLIFAAIGLFAVPLTISAQDSHGSGHGGGGGGGCGDVFGDLIHILRDENTGQPILARRFVELPKDEPGFGWGYCPIAVHYVDGEPMELPFSPYTCDVDPEVADLVEEVDYFGRLNGGRTKERNHRMHFNEVISNIKQADKVRREATGRLELGFDCEVKNNGKLSNNCSWSTIDSPMESMALYVRVAKYGHFQTDPNEEDEFSHGDPALEPQYHPALRKADWVKFEEFGLENLLPNGGDPERCFDGDVFDPDCAAPESLNHKDFMSGSTFLAAAAPKTGKITVDLKQYMNRILKITQNTNATASTKDTLPARVRDCWNGEVPVIPSEDEDPTEWDDSGLYGEDCEIFPADQLSAYYTDLCPQDSDEQLFPAVCELFVDYSEAEFERDFDYVDVILESEAFNGWALATGQSLGDWVSLVNGSDSYIIDTAGVNIKAAVAVGNDVIRAIEYIHNYDPPENLYCKYDPDGDYCRLD